MCRIFLHLRVCGSKPTSVRQEQTDVPQLQVSSEALFGSRVCTLQR